jgi:predicted nucleotidyltransferase
MRLTTAEIEAIRDCARKHFGEGCTVRLFGSRADDTRQGGDIDLHIEASSAELAALGHELRFRQELSDRLGDQRIDVIVRPPGYTPRAIDLIAVQSGITLA